MALLAPLGQVNSMSQQSLPPHAFDAPQRRDHHDCTTPFCLTRLRSCNAPLIKPSRPPSYPHNDILITCTNCPPPEQQIKLTGFSQFTSRSGKNAPTSSPANGVLVPMGDGTLSAQQHIGSDPHVNAATTGDGAASASSTNTTPSSSGTNSPARQHIMSVAKGFTPQTPPNTRRTSHGPDLGAQQLDGTNDDADDERPAPPRPMSPRWTPRTGSPGFDRANAGSTTPTSAAPMASPSSFAERAASPVSCGYLPNALVHHPGGTAANYFDEATGRGMAIQG